MTVEAEELQNFFHSQKNLKKKNKFTRAKTNGQRSQTWGGEPRGGLVSLIAQNHANLVFAEFALHIGCRIWCGLTGKADSDSFASFEGRDLEAFYLLHLFWRLWLQHVHLSVFVVELLAEVRDFSCEHRGRRTDS